MLVSAKVTGPSAARLRGLLCRGSCLMVLVQTMYTRCKTLSGSLVDLLQPSREVRHYSCEALIHTSLQHTGELSQ